MNNTDRILIVDDDAMMRMVLLDMLKGEFCVELCASGDEALQLINHQEYSVVLLDIQMAGRSGIETLKTIKEKSPLSQVIMVTGVGGIAEALQCGHLGAFDFVLKNQELTKERIFDRIQKALHYRNNQLKLAELEKRNEHLVRELEEFKDLKII